jgi:hypothetical protein
MKLNMKVGLIPAAMLMVVNAHALALSLSLDDVSPVVQQGGTVDVTGSFKISGPFDNLIVNIDPPYLSSDSSTFISAGLSSDFTSFLSGLTGTAATYTGKIFTIHASPTQTPGLYDHLPASSDAGFIEAIAFNSLTNRRGSAKASFDITVEAVPEPASIAAITIGVASLLRRRKSI